MNTYKMTLEDSVDSMTFDLLEVPIVDKDVEGAVDNTTLDGNIFTDYLWLKKNYVQKWSIMCDDEYSRLRGFYTRQFDNASVPTYKLFYGENISEDRAISGDYILVDNTTERNAPITSFELLGDAEQTTYSGKNKSPNLGAYYDAEFNANAGASITSHTDSTIVLTTGTSGSSGIYMSKAKIEAICPQIYQDGYTVSLTIASTQATDIRFNYNNKNTRVSIGTTATRISFQTDGSNTSPVVLYKATNDITPTLTISNIQVEAGSTATSYEPYVGGTASPNPDYPQPISVVTGEQTVTITNGTDSQTKTVNLGKNLFSGFATLATGSTYADGTLTLTTSSTNTSNDITVKPSTAYYLNFTAGAQTRIYVREYDSAGNMLVNTTKYVPYGFTTNANTAFVRIYFSPSTSEAFPVIIKDIQLEQSATPTDYAPYFTPIELAKIGTYQDRIYKDEGKWYIEKQVGKATVSLGTNVYTLSSGCKGSAYSPPDKLQTATGATLCDRATYVSSAGATYDGSYYENPANFMFAGSSTDDNTALKAKYDGAILYYPLATPTTTEITNSELVEQLEAILQAYLYTGTNNVSNNAVSPNLAGQMNIGYKLIYSEETVLIEPTAVRLTLTDGGIINVCGCRQNVQLTMRETIQ